MVGPCQGLLNDFELVLDVFFQLLSFYIIGCFHNLNALMVKGLKVECAVVEPVFLLGAEALDVNFDIAARQVVVVLVGDGFDGQRLIVLDVFSEGNLEGCAAAELVDFVVYELLQPCVGRGGLAFHDEILLDFVGYLLPVEVDGVERP